MADIVKNITDARDTGTINVYAVSYNGQKKNKNYAVALPGNLNDDFRDGFCENIVNYQNMLRDMSRQLVKNYPNI